MRRGMEMRAKHFMHFMVCMSRWPQNAEMRSVSETITAGTMEKTSSSAM